MGDQELRAWVVDEMVSGLRIDVRDAEAIAAACFDDDRGVVLSTDHRLDVAATVVSLVRATQRLPGRQDWWKSNPLAMNYLSNGNEYAAWCQVAEALAVEAPDAWDPNWPAHKAAKALLRRDPQLGDEYIVGNGEGSRARVRVESDNGQLRAIITEVFELPLDRDYETALEMAKTFV